MASSPAQLAGMTFTAITERFQKAITFDPGSKRQLAILHCLLYIQAEETIFKNAVQRFLKTDQLFDRIDWPTAEKMLESKLGEQYMVYNDSIRRVLAAVNALANLTHPDSSKAILTVEEWSEDKYDRFMLAVLDVDNSIEKQIKILRDANQRLISTQVDKHISLGKESTRFDKMRTKLSAAASVLGPNLGFDCLCHQKHAAFLKIPEWSRPQGQVVDEEFSLLFHNENDVCAWKCIEMSSNVKKVEEIHERGQDTTHEGGTGRQVRFAGDEFELEEDTDFITINAQAESARHLAVEATTGGISSPQHIELARPPSLCEYMASIQKEDNESGKFNVVMNTPSLSLRMTPIAALGRPVTLIPLELHFSERGGRPLTTLERLKLSTQVASAVLCLYHTTWLPEFWSYADIYLRHDGDGLKFNPWIVNSRTTGISSQAANDSTTSLTDPTILSLCRFLVELCFGAPLSRIRKAYGSHYELGRGEAAADRDMIETILSWATDETISPRDRPFYEEGRLYMDAASRFWNLRDATTDKWFELYLEVRKVAKRIRTDRPNKPDQRIRVAILDTGVDINDPFLKLFAIKRRIVYQDFAQPGSFSKLPVDEVGHGTHICGILLTIADNIDVYVARVSIDGKRWNGSQVAEAIKWAVEEKGVHIICLSFGFPYTTKQLDPIRRAILKANAADVLIFAAASNWGGNQPVAFPACMDEVICVGSADGRGVKSVFTPNLPQGKRLCVLGERIESSWPPNMLNGNESPPRKSGTSFATPVAAGVAAMVLDYMWTFKDKKEYKSCIPKLLTRRGMLCVFKQMVEEYPTHDYLVPWQLFNFRVSGDLDEDEDGGIMDIDGTGTVRLPEGRNPGMGIVEKIVGILRLL
ncbi:subtilisin DY [Trichoderma asperellum]|uniref:Subtilisin DY n=1 Tax=Trichoderma asperellum TaxID=101201 RepID=A0A6V8R0H6_TRIAP|nr:subtilisin DY [Trichoderma asperellum]